MSELESFEKDSNCIKCTGSKITVEYHRTDVYSDTLGFIAHKYHCVEEVEGEHLAKFCECGFTWQEEVYIKES